MKRSTASWTTAIAAAALLAMPIGSWAQQPSPTPSQTSRPAGAQSDQQGSANEHLRQAEAALNDIPAASLTGANKTKVAELKRHIGMLNRSASATASAKADKAAWSKEVAAADRILTELLGAQSTTGATEPGMTGTTGSTSTKPGARSKSSTSTTATLDDAARAKLQEVRTHLTAFAASMSGTGGATPSSDDPASPTSASAAAPSSPTPAASPSASASPSSPSSPSSPAAAPSSPAAAPSSPAAASSPSQAAPAQPPATPSEPAAAPTPQGQAAQAASPAQSVDTENVKRHLTAARDSLSQLTQLPAAAQLTGDARTQVSQLISNFNELITTNSNWRASYDKLQANLTALVGEQRADESPTPAAGTAGAVGTSGTTALDPGIRAKLVEFRGHLMDFEKAAGGGASASASPAVAPATPSPDTAAAAASPAAAPSTAAPAATPAEPPATPPASPTTSPAPATPEPSPATPEPTPATPEPKPTGTSGKASSTPAPAGTSGRAATPPAEGEAQANQTQPSAHQGQHGMSSEAMRHIEAIESILNGSTAAGTTGSSASKTTKSSVSSLDRAQIEQIRTHLMALRKALNESK